MKCFVIFLFAFCAHSALSKLEEKYRWKEVQYAWLSESAKKEAIASGEFKPENNFPLGLDIWRDKLFIALPR